MSIDITEELLKLKRGIEEHAIDTVWVDTIETACDRIDWMIEQLRGAVETSEGQS